MAKIKMKIRAKRVYPIPFVVGALITISAIGGRMSNGLEMNPMVFLSSISFCLMGLFISYVIYCINAEMKGNVLSVNYPFKKMSYPLLDKCTVDVVESSNSKGVIYCLRVSGEGFDDLYNASVFDHEELKSFINSLSSQDNNIKIGESFQRIMAKKPSNW